MISRRRQGSRGSASLRNLGWTAGRNIVVEYRSAEGHYSRLPALVEDVLQLNAEVILSS